MNKKLLLRIASILLYGILAGIGVNCFLVPANVYSGGVTGLSMLLSSLGKDLVNINIDTSAWVILVNLPLIILAYIKLGKKFTMYSFLAIISASLCIKFVPIIKITDNVLLASIFGGALAGIGAGICFRQGFSTGGTDIIVLVVQKLTGKSVGSIGFLLNGIIVSLAGLMYGLELGLYSLVSIFATTKLVDIFYIQQYKLTVNIYTKKKDEVVSALLDNNLRGVTVHESIKGGFTNNPLCSIVTVISKHELLFLKKIILDADEDAFVNVQPTMEVIGKFLDKSLI